MPRIVAGGDAALVCSSGISMYGPVLAAGELDGDRTHQQFFQLGSEARFPGTNDDYRCVRQGLDEAVPG